MVSCQELESYKYLLELKVYLEGDLKSFNEVASSCEAKETEDINNGRYVTTISGSSVTTTVETTKSPEMFAGSIGNLAWPVKEFSLDIPKYFRSTIPHALTLFSTIDIVGYFLGGGKEGQTSNNFRNFFDNKLPIEEMDILINVYRHGMSHGYFPKLGVGISYHSMNPHGKLFFLGHTGNLVLNVNEMKNIVLANLNSILNDCTKFDNIERQYQTLIKNYELNAKPAIDILVENLKSKSQEESK